MKSSWLAAAALIVVLALWMLSGMVGSEEAAQAPEDEVSTNKPLMTVEVMTAQSSLMSREIELHGQLEPVQHLRLRAQTGGIVREIFVHKGARVKLDDAIAQQDLGSRSSALAEAEAAVKTARSEQAAASALRQQRLQSQVQLEQAEAALEAAMARRASIALDIDNATIRAPFDAVVNDVFVDTGELVERGDHVVELVDDSAFNVSAQASQQVLSQLAPGQAVSVLLLDGQVLEGKLSYISSLADSQSRTFTVEARVNNPGAAVAAGVSATLKIPVEEVNATFISPSALSLSSDGALGIKALDADDRVVFLPVELISTSLDGAWVTGIPDGQRIVTLGQGFVSAGDKVQAQMAVE